MSRIFDALQRSGAEQSRVEYPDMVSVATAVFEVPQGPQSAEVVESAAHAETRRPSCELSASAKTRDEDRAGC